MWSNYQLEKAIATLTARTEEAWHNLDLVKQKYGYTLSTPSAVAMENPLYMKALNVWYAYRVRLEAAQKQMDRQKLN